MDSEALKEKGKELWEQIIKLETEKYDLEEKVKRQDYDVRLFKLNNIWTTFNGDRAWCSEN